MTAERSSRAPYRRTPPVDLDAIVFRLALLGCMDGLHAHGRRCSCRDCAGWRAFIASAWKVVWR